jgi:hypothetical protein
MKFTYYTIIGKNPNLIKGHINNVKTHAGFDRLKCDKEFVVIVYTNSTIPERTTDDILEICSLNNVRAVIYNETGSWLENLYACWNLGYSVSDDGLVFRGGSDQAFNYDSFVKLYDVTIRKYSTSPKILLNSNTIENSIRANSQGNTSRHITMDFGSSFDDFNLDKFEDYCKTINNNVEEELLTVGDSIRYWGKPTPFRSRVGIHNRTEGCSWLMQKEDWIKFGPMPTIDQWGITGDCHLHDELEINGYKDYLVRDCITYHFFRGECYDLFKKS